MDIKEKTCLKLKIFGKVQGVFFRVFVKKEAEKRRLKGWVKNNLDGTVDIEVLGEEKQLEKFIEKLWVGSADSAVERIEKKIIESEKDFENFEIKRNKKCQK